MAWSAIVAGFVRKKKPRVMWKREMEVMIVRAEMSAMVGGSFLFCAGGCFGGDRGVRVGAGIDKGRRGYVG